MLNARFGVGWPEGEHRGYGASDAEGFRINSRMFLKEGLIGGTVEVVLEGLLGGEVSFSVTYGI